MFTGKFSKTKFWEIKFYSLSGKVQKKFLRVIFEIAPVFAKEIEPLRNSVLVQIHETSFWTKNAIVKLQVLLTSQEHQFWL